MPRDAGRVIHLHGIVPPFAVAGLAAARADAPALLQITAAPALGVTGQTLWRAASLSKIATGQIARAALAGPDVTVESLLGWPLRHPAAPATPITVGQLASHTAGLTDDAGYLIAPGDTLQAWFARQGNAPFRADPPGARMAYCNLGYVLLAACAESATGQRFDHLSAALLARWGVAGGFNWAGVADRANRVAVFRRTPAGLAPQIDATVAPRGLSGPDGQEIPLDGWRPGANPGVFSPQGGLRLSLSGALALVQGLAADRGPWLWSGGPADDPGDLFQAYGWGVMRLDRPDIYPRPLIGHFANAYGLCAGAWWDDARQGAFAYVLNGLPLGDDDDRLRPEELAIFRHVAESWG